ncbi:MAG TPA: argininosuccinate lyase [Spirochaetia bacterium]|nr:argininosuccinate lyase [Spirochaetia bacterium]
MSKIWKKDYELNELVEEFTVGQDYLLDRRLVAADCLASLAHARMLASIGVLTPDELTGLERELRAIVDEFSRGGFAVERADEDCHTAIENRLTAKLGEAGKKIHTGRSRNDQVLAAVRLYARSFLLGLGEELTGLISELVDFAGTHRLVPMAGRTHMQPAMPSSVGLWAASFAEELLDDLSLLWAAYDLNNQSPLGSAASYGVPLPINREMVAEQLGFRGLQRNVLYVNNSRGKFESIIIDALDQCGLTLSKIAQDLILFSMPEFGYFSLPAELCSGSSIMPQKRNPDALELMRARAAAISAAGAQIKSTIRSLPSGYNRDFQDTKEPFLRALDTACGCVRIMRLTIARLEINEERLVAGLGPEIYATDAAYELVEGGMSFREAYREVGLHLESLGERDAYKAILQRTSTGMSGNLCLESISSSLERICGTISEERKRVEGAESSLAGMPIRLS